MSFLAFVFLCVIVTSISMWERILVGLKVSSSNGLYLRKKKKWRMNRSWAFSLTHFSNCIFSLAHVLLVEISFRYSLHTILHPSCLLFSPLFLFYFYFLLFIFLAFFLPFSTLKNQWLLKTWLSLDHSNNYQCRSQDQLSLSPCPG